MLDRNRKWTKSEKFALGTFLVTIIAIIVGLLTPEIRALVGLDKSKLLKSNIKKQVPKSEVNFENPNSNDKGANENPNNTQINFDRNTWEDSYFKPIKKGTYNVIVKSLGLDKDVAIQALQSLEIRFPPVKFKIMFSVASDGFTNKRYAIVIGQGLNYLEGKTLVKKAKSLGIAYDSYMTYQLWDVN